jgi:hypothetical protein
VFQGQSKNILEVHRPVIQEDLIQENITQKWKIVLAIELIESMTVFSPTDRPFTENILKHPLFWKDHQEFDFFNSLFHFLSHEGGMSKLRTSNIQTEAKMILHDDWIAHVKEDVQLELTNQNPNEVTALLQCIQKNVSRKFEPPRFVSLSKINCR